MFARRRDVVTEVKQNPLNGLVSRLQRVERKCSAYQPATIRFTACFAVCIPSPAIWVLSYLVYLLFVQILAIPCTVLRWSDALRQPQCFRSDALDTYELCTSISVQPFFCTIEIVSINTPQQKHALLVSRLLGSHRLTSPWLFPIGHLL